MQRPVDSLHTLLEHSASFAHARHSFVPVSQTGVSPAHMPQSEDGASIIMSIVDESVGVIDVTHVGGIRDVSHISPPGHCSPSLHG
jgi:hypothetical protein